MAYTLIVLCTFGAVLFYLQDSISTHWGSIYTDGWRYLPVLAMIDVLFPIALLLYVVTQQWKPAIYTIVLGCMMNLPVGFRYNLGVSGFIVSVIILCLLIVSRKKFV